MCKEPNAYQAYLLRLWETQDAQGPTWRVSLEDISTHTLHGFASLEKAFAFLREEVVNKIDEDQEDNSLALSE